MDANSRLQFDALLTWHMVIHVNGKIRFVLIKKEKRYINPHKHTFDVYTWRHRPNNIRHLSL